MSSHEGAARRHKTCRHLISLRKLIGAQFGFDYCPAPTWDMLLDLYLAHLEGRRIYLWSLCMAAHVPTSSAHRKIGELARKGLLTRSPDGEDGRRVSIELAPPCISRLDALLDQIAHQLCAD